MIEIDFKNISSGTIELHLKEVNFTQKISTYYFNMDENIESNFNESERALMSLNNLLDNWLKCMNSLIENERKSVYLPFDFADEYIGVVRVQLMSIALLKIDYGYSEEIRGYSIAPSKFPCVMDEMLNKYSSLSGSFICEKYQFVRDVKSIKRKIDELIN
jgi:hypothetical protein